MKYFLTFLIFLYVQKIGAQEIDTTDNARLAQLITLSETVVRTNLDVARFIDIVKQDTTFYKAFKNLRILSYTSLNNIAMFDSKGKTVASLSSKTKQHAADGCRSMEVIEEKSTGDFYKKNHNYNYFTAELYAGLFFTGGKICGQSNIVKDKMRSVQSKKGIEKKKEQLKMLFFDPGKKVTGIPLLGDKTAIFEENNSKQYNFFIDFVSFEGQDCYKFEIIAKEEEASKVVIDKMTTWFNARSMQIVARNYAFSYNAGVFDFDVQMEVQMTSFKNLLVPQTLRYTGNWDVAFKKREKGIFTATLFDFSN